ncbi:MAG: hypothetical protein EOM32_01170 [Spirochaetia bacterium]|nr:hypothetical protein [Spirochaetia bacterium]NCC89474.1 hypothetical protein [Spirochaetia bacterium]
MTKRRYLIILLAFSLFLVSCGTLFTAGGSEYRSAMSAYKAQEYEKAFLSLSDALRINPTFEEALSMYPVVFNEGSSFYRVIITNAGNKNDLASADRLWSAYRSLYAMHERARSDGRGVVAFEDYAHNVKTAGQKAGELWFGEAERLASRTDRKSQQEAVAAYEKAKLRYPELPNLEQRLATALAKATVSLMVVGSGPDDAFHSMVLADIKKTFAQNRFVQVMDSPSFLNTSTTKGPTELAIEHARANQVNYLLEIMVYNRTEQILTEEPVRLPRENPLFDGIKRTMGYSIKNTVSYRLFDLRNLKVIAGNTFATEEGPYTYDFSYVKAEGLRELNLENTGKRNLRFVSTNSAPDIAIPIINQLRTGYYNIPRPSTIADPTDQTLWTAYYKDRYRSFRDLAQQESGRQLFYAIEVVHHLSDDTYTTLGMTVEEAVQESKVNSAIMNALSHTARALIDAEKQTRGSSYQTIGMEVGKLIKDIF